MHEKHQNGLRFCFRIGFRQESICLKSAKVNCASAQQHPSVIDDDLPKEVMLGLVFGPVAHISHCQTCKLVGLAPFQKKTMCLSFPFGPSVNDGINKEEFTLTYSKVSDAIALIKAGRSALMGKVDIKSAYASFQYIHPIDINYACFGTVVIMPI